MKKLLQIQKNDLQQLSSSSSPPEQSWSWSHHQLIGIHLPTPPHIRWSGGHSRAVTNNNRNKKNLAEIYNWTGFRTSYFHNIFKIYIFLLASLGFPKIYLQLDESEIYLPCYQWFWIKLFSYIDDKRAKCQIYERTSSSPVINNNRLLFSKMLATWYTT